MVARPRRTRLPPTPPTAPDLEFPPWSPPPPPPTPHQPRASPLVLCVLVRTFIKEVHASLPALLASLHAAIADEKSCTAAGRPLRVSAHVFPTDTNTTVAEETFRRVRALSDAPFFAPAAAASRLRIHAHRRASGAELEEWFRQRCGSRRLTYDCGYLQTDLAMQRVLKRASSSSSCDYVLVTNGDNLYARSLFAHACSPLVRGIQLTAFYFSSHYPYSHVYVQQGRVERSGPDVLFKARLAKGWVDLGAVIVSADLLRTHARESYFTDCRAWREADGRYVQRLAALNSSRQIIDRILYLHQ